MELTVEEREAVEKGDIVKYVIPNSHIECILVRQDLLEPIRLQADYSPCDPDELCALTGELLDDEDWTEPAGLATEQPS